MSGYWKTSEMQKLNVKDMRGQTSTCLKTCSNLVLNAFARSMSAAYRGCRISLRFGIFLHRLWPMSFLSAKLTVRGARSTRLEMAFGVIGPSEVNRSNTIIALRGNSIDILLLPSLPMWGSFGPS